MVNSTGSKSIVNLRQSVHIIKYIVLTICFTACTGFSELKIGDVSNVEVKGFEENSFLVTVKLNVDNPTHHKIRVTDINSKVFLNNQYIGKIVSVEQIEIPANSIDDYSIVLRVRLTNILGTAFAMMQLSDGNRVNVRLEGDITVHTMLLKKKIQINESRLVTI
jgi:LEA14-like dessication related protein